MTYRMYYGTPSGITEVTSLRALPVGPDQTDFIGECVVTTDTIVNFLELHDGNGYRIRSDYFNPTRLAPSTTVVLTLQLRHEPGAIDPSQYDPLPKPPAFTSVAEADAWLEGQR